MALQVLNQNKINPSAVWYSGQCATCFTVVYGQLADWTFYQATPAAQLAPAATVPPILFPQDDTGHIIDWLFVKCPTSGCPATIWTPTKRYSLTAPVKVDFTSVPYSNVGQPSPSPSTSQPLT